jgi:hypothetical protein
LRNIFQRHEACLEDGGQYFDTSILVKHSKLNYWREGGKDGGEQVLGTSPLFTTLKKSDDYFVKISKALLQCYLLTSYNSEHMV